MKRITINHAFDPEILLYNPELKEYIEHQLYMEFGKELSEVGLPIVRETQPDNSEFEDYAKEFHVFKMTGYVLNQNEYAELLMFVSSIISRYKMDKETVDQLTKLLTDK